MVLRFGNTIFEPLWSRAARRPRADHRGRGHRRRGARQASTRRSASRATSCRTTRSRSSRSCAMEPPIVVGRDAVRDEKVKVLRTLRPIRGARRALDRTVRGQYGAGHRARRQGARLPRGARTSRPDSKTETYVAMRLELDIWRWGGVPFYLRAGKRLAKRRHRGGAPLQEPAARPLPGHAGRDRRAQRARHAHPARRGHLAALRDEGARARASPCATWRWTSATARSSARARRRRTSGSSSTRCAATRRSSRARTRWRRSGRFIDPILAGLADVTTRPSPPTRPGAGGRGGRRAARAGRHVEAAVSRGPAPSARRSRRSRRSSPRSGPPRPTRAGPPRCARRR